LPDGFCQSHCNRTLNFCGERCQMRRQSGEQLTFIAVRSQVAYQRGFRRKPFINMVGLRETSSGDARISRAKGKEIAL